MRRSFFILILSLAIAMTFSQTRERYYLITVFDKNVNEILSSILKASFLEVFTKYIEIIDEQNSPFIDEVKRLQETGQMDKTPDAFEKFKILSTDKIMILKVNKYEAEYFISFAVVGIRGTIEFTIQETIPDTARITDELKNIAKNVAFNYISKFVEKSILFDSKKGLPVLSVEINQHTFKIGETIYIRPSALTTGVLYLFERIGETLFFYKEVVLTKNQTTIRGTLSLPAEYTGEKYEETILLLLTTNSQQQLSSIKNMNELGNLLKSLLDENWEIEYLFYTIER